MSDLVIPSQAGRTAVITGANSGIGFVAARRLGEAGARVVLACRSAERAAAAVASLQERVPEGQFEWVQLDLASLASVRAAAAQVRERVERVDLLINNAGIMAIPRTLTPDGFEMQLGTNHLGHFAWTGLLVDRVLHPGARVVTLSSNAHKMGWLHLDNLMRERRYEKWFVYGQSKLANLLFAYELQRRLAAAGAPTMSVACHPGWASTNLQMVGPQVTGSKLSGWFWGAGNRYLAQDAEAGALPTLLAATGADVEPGACYGPSRWFEMIGAPKRVQSNPRSHNLDDAKALWERSIELTGVDFATLAPGATS